MLGRCHLTPGFVGGGIFRVKRPSLHVSQKLVKAEVLFKPAHCEDTTGNHPNHFLLGFRACAFISHTEQTGQGPGRT